MFENYTAPQSASLRKPPDFSGSPSTASLIPTLVGLGYDKIPAGARYYELVYAEPPKFEMTPAADLLALDPDGLRAIALERARDKVTAEAAIDQFFAVKTELFAAWEAWLTDHVDDVVGFLAPLFDKASVRARMLSEAGVQPGAKAADVIERGPKLIDAWLKYRREDVPDLRELANARADLAIWTRTAPVNHMLKWRWDNQGDMAYVDMTPCILGGHEAGRSAQDLQRDPAEAFFLRHAGSLAMATPAEIEAVWTERHGDEPGYQVTAEQNVKVDPQTGRLAKLDGPMGSPFRLPSTGRLAVYPTPNNL